MKKEKTLIDISYESILRLFVVILVMFFFYYIREVIFTILIAVLLALTMEPAVDRMQKKNGVPRVFGTGLIFASSLAILTLLIYIVAPTLASEVALMANTLPQYLEKFDYRYIIDNGQSMGLDSGAAQNIFDKVSSTLSDIAGYLVTGTMGFVGGIFSAVLIAVISFYLVLEDDGIEKFIRATLPDEFHERGVRIINKTEEKLGQWFVGQITLCFIVGAFSFIGLSLIGVPYALVLAIVAGALELIPYIGPMLSAVPAILIALTVSPQIAAMTFVLYFLIQEFENYLIVPKVMEKSVGLHPVIIIVAAAIGEQLAGILGMILAVPIATVVAIVYNDIRRERAKDC